MVAASATRINLFQRDSAAIFLLCETSFGSANRLNGWLSAEEVAFRS